MLCCAEAVPKKILELMKVDGLTRENVASHLQKYRLYLKRVQQNAPAAAAYNGPASAAAVPAAAGVGSGSFPAAALGMSAAGMMGGNQLMWGNSTQVRVVWFLRPGCCSFAVRSVLLMYMLRHRQQGQHAQQSGVI
jgi:hypothetical protein